jgi:hypothetical protein
VPRPHSRSLRLICSLLGACALSAGAQTAIQPGSIVGTFNAAGFASNAGEVIFTVPGDRNARVTDVKVHHLGSVSQLCQPMLVMGATDTYFPINQPKQSVIQALNTGYGLVPGQTVRAYNNECTASSIYVEIRGFYFTIP